jgi:enoyl-CoA hydratase/carnithine racemase
MDQPASAPRTARPPEGDWLGTPHLRFERHGPLAHCIVDRPEKRNAMTPAMYFGIRRAVDVVNRDPELAGLLITGTADVFIAGGDMSLCYDDDWADLSGLLHIDNTPFEAIRNSPKPVVSAVNGIAEGGGMMIAMLSDVALASDRARFRAPELLRGIADMNYAQVLPHQVGFARARDLLLTARTLSAEEAVDWGVVTRLVAHDDLLTTAVDVLTKCCWAAPRARAQVKGAINMQYGLYDRMTFDATMYDPEFAEGWRAFAERRAPDWIAPEIRPDGRI